MRIVARIGLARLAVPTATGDALRRDAFGSNVYTVRALLSACFALSAALAVSGFGWADAPRTGGSSQIVVVSKCGAVGVQRPKELVFTCADAGLRVQHMHWSSWGGRVAVARGEQFANDCDPACVSGTFHRTAVIVHLYKRRGCPGRAHLYYRDATIIDAAGHRTGARVTCPDV